MNAPTPKPILMSRGEAYVARMSEEKRAQIAKDFGSVSLFLKMITRR